MSEQRCVFISFGGPTPNYHERVHTLCNEVKRCVPTIETIAYTEKDLQKNKEGFWCQHGNFLETQKRGYGYWLWKPYLIQKVMNEELQENDILIYADAGCTFNPYGHERLQEYIQLLQTSPFGLLAFQLEPRLHEIKYTKRLLLEYCETTIEDMRSPQFMATVVMLRKTGKSIEFVNKWYSLASRYGYLDDTRHPTRDEYKAFIDHRHDQSIYSLLVKAALRDANHPGPIVLSDETFFHPDWWKRGQRFPFWATRIK